MHGLKAGVVAVVSEHWNVDPAAVEVKANVGVLLNVTDASDGIDYDHADWAGARLTTAATPTIPAAPTGLAAAPAVSGDPKFTHSRD